MTAHYDPIRKLVIGFHQTKALPRNEHLGTRGFVCKKVAFERFVVEELT